MIRRPSFPLLALAAVTAAAGAACAPAATGRAPAAAAPAPSVTPAFRFPFGALGRVDTVAPTVVHADFVVRESGAHGRWAVHVLRAAPGACVTAIKAADAAFGRAPTSEVASRFARGDSARPGPAVFGAVNADFFALGTGLPTGAHVQNYRVIAGPTRRPLFTVDSSGRATIQWLYAFGAFVRDGGSDTLGVSAWNRPANDGVTLFDGEWGSRTDSVPGRLFVRLRPARLFSEYKTAGVAPGRYRVVSIATGAATALGPLAYVVAVGPDAPAAERARWAALRAGAIGDFGLGIFPSRPREAVGGFPVLVRRGAVAPEVDTAGAAAFRGPNPRTAVGIAADGGLLLVTVDGRQPGHSDGATLRETAELLQAMGAVDALNLDGGGSTTMVVRGAGDRLAVVNRPSDATGERPVANALALRACPGSGLTGG